MIRPPAPRPWAHLLQKPKVNLVGKLSQIHAGASGSQITNIIKHYNILGQILQAAGHIQGNNISGQDAQIIRATEPAYGNLGRVALTPPIMPEHGGPSPVGGIGAMGPQTGYGNMTPGNTQGIRATNQTPDWAHFLQTLLAAQQRSIHPPVAPPVRQQGV